MGNTINFGAFTLIVQIPSIFGANTINQWEKAPKLIYSDLPSMLVLF